MGIDDVKNLPDELEAALGDYDLSLDEKILIEYLYEEDIYAIRDRCDRNQIKEDLDFSDRKIDRITDSLAADGIIKTEEFPSKFYHRLDIQPLPSTDEHHDGTADEHRGDSVDEHHSDAADECHSDSTGEHHDDTNDEHHGHSTDQSTAKPAISMHIYNQINQFVISRRQPPVENYTGQSHDHKPSNQELPAEDTASTPPEPIRFLGVSSILAALPGLLDTVAGSSVLFIIILVNLAYAVAFRLADRGITPPDAVTSRLNRMQPY